jgi:hypothetical protein
LPLSVEAQINKSRIHSKEAMMWKQLFTFFSSKDAKYSALRTRAYHGHPNRLGFERLEDRRVLATLTVSVSSDGPIANNDGNLTLREAIAYVNGTSEADAGDLVHIDLTYPLASTTRSSSLLPSTTPRLR